MCDFHEPYFGANYPDACCIDGYLWDLDSCDVPGGGLTSGGDDPCPQCNHAAFLERVIESKTEEGWLDGDDGKPREYTHRKLRHEQPGDEEACRAAWLKGYDEGSAQRVANVSSQTRQGAALSLSVMLWMGSSFGRGKQRTE